MEDREILEIIKAKSEGIMNQEKLYHDWGHALGVYKNMEKLLKVIKGNKMVLLPASLLHDTRRDLPNHGTEGALYSIEILMGIPEFPRELIGKVANVIFAHDKKQETLDEKLLYDADKMDAFTNLGTIRTFLMYSQKGVPISKACWDYLDLLHTFYITLHTKPAKIMAKKSYEETRRFTWGLINKYNEK